jgi:hypothetical protein
MRNITNYLRSRRKIMNSDILNKEEKGKFLQFVDNKEDLYYYFKLELEFSNDLRKNDIINQWNNFLKKVLVL